jgi:thiamine phosphate synthase YjbQ (UPF0047 family)
VPKKTSKPLDKELIDQWPEILEEINLSAIPIIYLDSIIITFFDGTHWKVTISEEDRSIMDDLSETLNTLFKNHGKNIEHVDFRLDIEKIKKDITKLTKKFLKRKK